MVEFKKLIFAAILAFSTIGTAFAALPSQFYPVRALHFVLWGASIEDAKRVTDEAKASGFNTLVIALGDAVKLSTFPGKLRADAWSADEFVKFVGYARKRGFNVIPDVRLLSHQESFFGSNHPELMYNSSTYDPRNAKVYTLTTAYLDQLIGLIHPAAIHIGHDEVSGWLYQRTLLPGKPIGLLPGESGLSADLFLQDVLKIHDYLKNKGVETWMWADMLTSPNEFPTMLSTGLHGGGTGYGKALRDQLPRDIVICDWHYNDLQPDYPSLTTMQNEGFRVIGSTWKNNTNINNFSRYAGQYGAYGMMATTWFHVRNHEWDVVNSIIRDSGTAYNKDFPRCPTK